MNFEINHPLEVDDEIPSIANCRVLVIDDSPLTCKLIRTRLEIEGISQIEAAHDGRQGLEKLESFAPDLVILDIQLPVIEGREVLRLIRAKSKYDNLPVIVEAAMEGDIDREELVEMGATNIITKPINHNLLAMRVRLHLEHKLLIKDLRNYRRRLGQELNLARKMQAELLPSESDVSEIAEKHHLQIEDSYQPCSEMGGDFWSIRSIDDHQIALLMIDFSGHGIGASINTFRLNMILGNMSPSGKSPVQFLERLNRELSRYLSPIDFATAFFGILNTETHSFNYAAAGSPPPITINSKTRDIAIGESHGVPLGINPSATYEPRHLDFTPDTSLFLFSDAFPEAIDANGDPLGIEGMAKLIEAGLDTPSSIANIEKLLMRFYAGVRNRPNDDMTLVSLRKIDSC